MNHTDSFVKNSTEFVFIVQTFLDKASCRTLSRNKKGISSRC